MGKHADVMSRSQANAEHYALNVLHFNKWQGIPARCVCSGDGTVYGYTGDRIAKAVGKHSTIKVDAFCGECGRTFGNLT